MTALRLLIEGVRDGLLEGGSEAPALEGMLGHVRRLGALVDGLEAPRAGETTCVPPVLRDASRRVAQHARERRIAVRVDAEGALPGVECSAELLAPVFVALLEGGVARTSPGGEVALGCGPTTAACTCTSLPAPIDSGGEPATDVRVTTVSPNRQSRPSRSAPNNACQPCN